MRRHIWLTVSGLALFLAGCTDGQIIDSSGEAGGGDQAGGGGLAFRFMVVVIVVITLLLFALDRIRRARLEAEEAREAAAREQSST